MSYARIKHGSCRSASRRKTWIERHSAIDEDAGAADIVGLVGGEERGYTPDIFRLPDAFVGDQSHEGVVSFWRVPGGRVDRRADRARADTVNADPVRRDLLSDARPALLTIMSIVPNSSHIRANIALT